MTIKKCFVKNEMSDEFYHDGMIRFLLGPFFAFSCAQKSGNKSEDAQYSHNLISELLLITEKIRKRFEIKFALFSMSGNLLEQLGWAPGDRCYAQYSEDNLWYPAIIMKEEKGYVFCLVVDFWGNITGGSYSQVVIDHIFIY